MRIEYWGVDDELKKNPHFLHDREAQYRYIKKRKRDFSHYDMVMMYRFDSAMDTEECDGCGSNSIIKHLRFNCSQAIRVEPLPPNKSTIA